jgi:predicted transcriptional regulator
LEAEGRSLTESTVRTMLRILEQKGYLTHDVDGRTFHYRPRVERNGATGSILRDVLNRVFSGSPSLLVKSLLSEEKVSETELEQIKQLIAEKEEANV